MVTSYFIKFPINIPYIIAVSVAICNSVMCIYAFVVHVLNIVLDFPSIIQIDNCKCENLVLATR